MDLNYVIAGDCEGISGHYKAGVKIYVATGDRELNEEEKSTIGHMTDIIYRLLLKGHAKADVEDVEAGQKEIKHLLACFPVPTTFEEIPNGYSNDYWTVNRPWLKVSTYKGTISIGWRKRVINIDWSQSNVKEMANDLFPQEDVTKGEKYIHAWGYDKAKEYLSRILT